ncbi:MAG: WG repeat-containing protein [Candidatus Adiutrix sp.]|jgi:hypothetical protein|nr:WG repeat-containing protein [Candidatus Adiutrix sp.]
MSGLSKIIILSLAVIIASAAYLGLGRGGLTPTGEAVDEEMISVIPAAGPALVEESAAWLRFVHGGKMGFTNTQSEVVIPAAFDYALDFSAKGLAAVKVNGQWGYINSKGEMAVPARFDFVWRFADNGLAAVKVGGRWGFINQSARRIDGQGRL